MRTAVVSGAVTFSTAAIYFKFKKLTNRIDELLETEQAYYRSLHKE